MSRPLCTSAHCTRPAMRREVLAAKLGARGVAGLCPLHTIRAVVRVAAQNQGRTAYHSDPEPLAEWITAARSSATLTVGGLTVHDVTLRELAEVTGVTPKTLAELGAGLKTYVHASTCAKLTPWLLTVDPSPRGGTLTVGRNYAKADMAYAPLGTVVVDSRGRAWQLRGKSEYPRWCPAHLKRSTTPPSLDNGSAWPVLVVHIPARVYSRTTF